MNSPTRGLRSVLLLFAVGLSLALLAPFANAAEGGITYEHESEAAFAKQLTGRQIQSAIINKRVRTVRLTLKDGRHVLAKYPKHHEPQTLAELKAKGATVTVLSKAQAEKAVHHRAHHKLRYIVGGIAVAVIVVVVVALLVYRRRQRD